MNVRFRRDVAATHEAVDAFCAELSKQIETLESESDRFAAELLARESLMNAVVHGSEGIPEKRVACEVTIENEIFRMEVSDFGGGFDWREALAVVAARKPGHDRRTRGRGLQIILTYADTLSFNERGNGVVITRKLGRMERGDTMNTEIKQDGKRIVVHPAGDVVASSVKEMRPMIKDFVDRGVDEVIFDLDACHMVDSAGIGLLVAVHNSMVKNSGKLSVIHASQEILALFRAMRIDRHFSVSGA